MALLRQTPCPACAEDIPADAVVCPYCETRFAGAVAVASPAASPEVTTAGAAATPAATDPHSVPAWVAAGLVLAAIFVWPLGLAVGAAMALSRHPQQKKVGKLTLGVSVAVVVLAALGGCSSLLLEAPYYY